MTFKKTGLPIYYEKKEKLNKSNKIKYGIIMINDKGCKFLSFSRKKCFKNKLNLAKWFKREVQMLLIFVVTSLKN